VAPDEDEPKEDAEGEADMSVKLEYVLREQARRRATATRPCDRCGAFLDAPRRNEDSRRIERKCSQCLRWSPLTPEEELREAIRARAIDRRRRAA
jgi:hypothetical protein